MEEPGTQYRPGADAEAVRDAQAQLARLATTMDTARFWRDTAVRRMVTHLGRAETARRTGISLSNVNGIVGRRSNPGPVPAVQQDQGTGTEPHP